MRTERLNPTDPMSDPPRTAAVLGDIETRRTELFEHILEVLATATDVREVDLAAESLLADLADSCIAYAELHGALHHAAVPPEGASARPQTPRTKSEPQPRNAPGRCGSGLKSKHCRG